MDLVRQQILIASGEPLRLHQRDVEARCHAIECRINAEDADRNFAPSAGKIENVILPGGYGVRVDWGALGYETTVYLTITAVPGYQLGLIMEELADIAEIDEVLLVTGPFDMLVRMRARDERHLRDLLLNRIWQIEGIQRTETSITIAQMKPKNTAEELLTAMLDNHQYGRAGSAAR